MLEDRSARSAICFHFDSLGEAVVNSYAACNLFRLTASSNWCSGSVATCNASSLKPCASRNRAIRLYSSLGTEGK